MCNNTIYSACEFNQINIGQILLWLTAYCMKGFQTQLVSLSYMWLPTTKEFIYHQLFAGHLYSKIQKRDTWKACSESINMQPHLLQTLPEMGWQEQ